MTERSRPTPFDLVFGGKLAAFDEIRADAHRVGRDPRSPVDFPNVPATQRILDEVESEELVTAQPLAAAEYLAMLYASYRFWDAGRVVIPIDRGRLAARLADDPPNRRPEIPAGACYLQFPLRWFWAQIAPEAPHEPLDGMFVTAAPRGDQVTLLAVFGLHPDRAGFGQISVSVHPDDIIAARDAIPDARFAPDLPGGEAAGLRSITAVGELLLLAHLALTSQDR